MPDNWLLWLVHGSANVAALVLAGRDVWALRSWEAKAWTTTGVDDTPPLIGDLVDQLHRSRSATARVALLNEATSEFESEIGFGRVGSVGWRVCVASGVGSACFVMVNDLPTALACLGSGLVGGLLTWNLGRMADSRARRLRERWNGLIRRLSGSFPQSDTFGDRPSTM